MLLFIADILINQMEARFSDSFTLLLLMPSSINSPSVRDDEDAWLEAVEESLDMYRDELPDQVTLSTELLTWRDHWLVTHSTQMWCVLDSLI